MTHPPALRAFYDGRRAALELWEAPRAAGSVCFLL